MIWLIYFSVGDRRQYPSHLGDNYQHFNYLELNIFIKEKKKKKKQISNSWQLSCILTLSGIVISTEKLFKMIMWSTVRPSAFYLTLESDAFSTHSNELLRSNTSFCKYPSVLSSLIFICCTSISCWCDSYIPDYCYKVNHLFTFVNAYESLKHLNYY